VLNSNKTPQSVDIERGDVKSPAVEERYIKCCSECKKAIEPTLAYYCDNKECHEHGKLVNGSHVKKVQLSQKGTK